MLELPSRLHFPAASSSRSARLQTSGRLMAPVASSAGTPAVSVIMPAYNAQGHIATTLASVQAQTFTDFELLVVDDCSTDSTAEMVRAFSATDERVRLIELKRNYGTPAGPRNVGVRSAGGEWIAFIDADDIWHPRKLEVQMQTIAATGAQFCSTGMLDFKDEAGLRFTDPSKLAIETLGFLSQLVKCSIVTSSVVVRRELITRIPFNESLRYKAREDFDCWLHCHEEIGKSVKIMHPMVGYRITSGQISGSKWRMVRRHYHVLRRYRFRSGGALGIGAVVFTFSHFLLSLYYRLIKKGL